MPNPTEVAIIKRDGSVSLYTDYATARASAVSNDRDMIQIRADLNEPIVLKDKVDIWIMPGVELRNTSGDTITDKVSGVSQEVHCKIYGEGKIINTSGYSCIFLDNINSELCIECDSFDTSEGNSTSIHINRASKFHLICNRILSKGSAIYLGYPSTDIIEDVLLKINKVETGDTTSNPISGTSIVVYANGYITIEEIICKNYGHCLLHRKGKIIARINKMIGITINTGLISTLLVGQGDGNQNLVLYFDEIQNLRGTGSSTTANTIEIAQGTCFLIGRRIFSNDGYAVSITQPFPLSSILTNANINCEEIESKNFSGIFISNVTNEVIIKANVISGYSYYCPVSGQGSANFLIKNSHLINRDNTSNSRCIVLEETNNNIPNMTLNNVKAITGNMSSGSIIYQANFTGVNVKNYGLFSNKLLDSGITLTIGDDDNFLFIQSDYLT